MKIEVIPVVGIKRPLELVPAALFKVMAPWQCDHQAFQLGESLTVDKGFKQLIRLKAHF